MYDQELKSLEKRRDKQESSLRKKLFIPDLIFCLDNPVERDRQTDEMLQKTLDKIGR